MRAPQSLSLGQFLRAKRHSAAPIDAAKQARRRRTPGLRREEVAELANISLDWYARLEQDRAGTPSPTALAGICRALRLNPSEEQYLHLLAGHLSPARSTVEQDLHPSTRAILRRLHDVPACVIGPSMDVLACNALYDALFPGFSAHPTWGRNCVWAICCAPGAAAMLDDHEAAKQEAVAALRLAFASDQSNVALQELIAALRRDAPDFDSLWAMQHVAVKAHGQRVFKHPEVATMVLDWHSFVSPAEPRQRVKMFEPADAASAHALEQLRIRVEAM
ncbi:MAG TPA: helix-turn-helix transcriptional regulator [Polyangiales bacterium]|nr:helix-turn-helix transcriptional regulator [Polyangiales bacterium]